MNFEDIRLKMLDAYKVLVKMDINSLNMFAETHALAIDISFASDLKLAQNYVYYKYYEKLCALNVIKMQEKWEKRLKEAELKYKDQFNKTEDAFIKRKKYGGRASIIKQMLLEGKSRDEIRIVVSEAYPNIPLSNIGCQIAATICFLKRREEKGVKNANLSHKSSRI